VTQRSLGEPKPGRLPFDQPQRDEILAAHSAAIEAGEAGYLDPVSGPFVLTAATLLDHGECCDRGCRHCPYID
jgi:hypothetical protein